MLDLKLPASVRISGYASVFSKPDLSGDRVMRGAFAASLLTHAGRPLPMLFGHETVEPIGIWDRVIEDGRGLFVQGRIMTGNARADRIASLVTEGALTGLSIGYRVRRSQPRPNGGRDLTELDLWEVSIVAFPMLRDARLSLTQSHSRS
ncbi:HK97 family phage prohead protease [Fretibacter rubidus]|uniref:HK97 family phage prohead protease n=1 Tax=Fretibacter rubidus TaxID=570162 RepID=UPI00352A14B3